MLLVRDVSIEAGARALIIGATFSVQAGDKIGLVGPNGAGKTTLLRTLAGYRSSAEGAIRRSGVIGYLSQEAAVAKLPDEETTALERILSARAIGDLERHIETTRLEMESASAQARDRLIKRFSRLEDEFTARGGYIAKAEAKRFAHSLGIGSDELEQRVATMSGGQRRRVELARILFKETDTLMLDEPTNHLDLDAKAWLVSFLDAYEGGLLVVSHDLPLLDASITSVLSVEDHRIEAYRGNYSNFLSERERRREQRIKERRHQEEKIARLEQGIRRFKGTTEKMAKRARSWETRVEKMRGQLVEVGKKRKGVVLRFPQPEPSGSTPLNAEGLGKAFGHTVVFVDVDVDVDRGERLAIIGLNGAGKTTLLKILAGVDSPDVGDVEIGYRVSVGYYAQEHENLDLAATVLDHMRRVSGLPDQQLRGVLGHFLLADKIDQEAGSLSGGEKTKLALATLVVGRHNVLLLDEPTNNLDPQAKGALLDALDQYEGTIILVSHDVEFVAGVAPDRAVLMPDGETAYFDETMLELVELA